MSFDMVIKFIGITGRSFAKEYGFSESYYASDQIRPHARTMN